MDETPFPEGASFPPSLPEIGSAGTTPGAVADRATELPATPPTGFRRTLGRGLNLAIGALATVAALAVASAIPGLNLVSLGFLLEASARVARTGRWREAWIGIHGFARAGKILLAVWICFLPVRLAHGLWHDSELISGPGSNGSLRILFVVLAVAAAVHVFWALRRGGGFRHFLWPAPLLLMRWLVGVADPVSPFPPLRPWIRGLALWHFFRLGALGFAGALLWLGLPVGLLYAASRSSLPVFSVPGTFLGFLLLAGAALVLPFLQTRFARTGKFHSFLEPGAAHRGFLRAPLAYWLALVSTLLLALPPYLLKIELTPREVAWLPNLLLVLLVFPARILLGWALFRSDRREFPRHWASRWAARLGALPVLAIYVVWVWVMQYLGWQGSWGLWEQHAFLIPAALPGG